MVLASRKLALVLLAGFVLLATGCGSNNKGKIEGKWKITGFPEKTTASTKADMTKMSEAGMYIYLEFKADGGLAFGLGTDKPELLQLLKASAPNQKISGTPNTNSRPATVSRSATCPRTCKPGVGYSVKRTAPG